MMLAPSAAGSGAVTCPDAVCSTFQARDANNCCVSDVGGGVLNMLTLKGLLWQKGAPTMAGVIVYGGLGLFALRAARRGV